jgi:DnaJ-class molecular chaperone
MWQKCPICNGTGCNNSLDGGIFTNKCRTCDGKGIISEVTGLPPNNYYKTNTANTSTDFRDNCQQFEDK